LQLILRISLTTKHNATLRNIWHRNLRAIWHIGATFYPTDQ
jgi:hypothetical protein